jgi:hypothetical protein
MAVGMKGLLRASVLLFYPITLCWCLPVFAVPVSIPPLMTAAEMLMQLNQRLVHSKNAPATLNHWCNQQLNNAEDLQIVVDTDRQLPPPANVYQLLKITPDTQLSYLKQRFLCGGKVVAVFDHWFRADMLTPAMQQALAKKTHALGSIARDAGFFRRSLSNNPLWPDEGALPVFVLEHLAVIYRSDNTPFSLVQEHYTRQLLPRAQQLDPY